MNAHYGCWNSDKRFASLTNVVLERRLPNDHYTTPPYEERRIPHTMSTKCMYSRDRQDDPSCSGCRHHSNPPSTKETQQ